jgi:hypothetical protein
MPPDAKAAAPAVSVPDSPLTLASSKDPLVATLAKAVLALASKSVSATAPARSVSPKPSTSSPPVTGQKRLASLLDIPIPAKIRMATDAFLKRRLTRDADDGTHNGLYEPVRCDRPRIPEPRLPSPQSRRPSSAARRTPSTASTSSRVNAVFEEQRQLRREAAARNATLESARRRNVPAAEGRPTTPPPAAMDVDPTPTLSPNRRRLIGILPSSDDIRKQPKK